MRLILYNCIQQLSESVQQLSSDEWLITFFSILPYNTGQQSLPEIQEMGEQCGEKYRIFLIFVGWSCKMLLISSIIKKIKTRLSMIEMQFKVAFLSIECEQVDNTLHNLLSVLKKRLKKIFVFEFFAESEFLNV